MPIGSSRVTGRDYLVVSLVAVVSLAGAATLGLTTPIREPSVHDEFSYLLAGDTFAHGRLTNPTPELWRHFETIHVIQQPTYASKYPPAQGLFLALGQFFFSLPSVGIWLSASLMCASTCWMLLRWFSPAWALLGAFVLIARFGIAGDWAQGYYGGATAAAGGALVCGAVPRLLASPTAAPTACLAAGILLLLNSRPFEGLAASLPSGVALAVSLLKRRRDASYAAVRKAFIVAGAIVMLGGIWMGYYNYRVTGNALLLPYSVYSEAYLTYPLLIFQPLRETPPIRHQRLREFSKYAELPQRIVAEKGFWHYARHAKFGALYGYYLANWWALPLIALPWVLRDRWAWFCSAIVGTTFLATLVSSYTAGQYVAPALAAGVALWLGSVRQLSRIRLQGVPLGWMAVASVVLLALVTLVDGVQVHAQPADTWGPKAARASRAHSVTSGTGTSLSSRTMGRAPCTTSGSTTRRSSMKRRSSGLDRSGPKPIGAWRVPTRIEWRGR